MVSGFHGWRFLCPVLLLTIVLPHAAQAWQFRELDDDAPVQAADDATDESSGLIDLTPIKESFTATDSDETPRQVTKVQSKKDEKKTVPQPVAKPTPKVAPEPKTPKPAKAKAAADEPQGSSAVRTDAKKTVDALELIKQGIDAIPEGEEVYSISYSGIVPGQSNLKDVVAQLGEASHTIEQGENAATHVYQAAPYQLDVAIVDDVVTSILVRLQQSAARDELIERLGLESLKSVPIPDEYGEVLGQAYPERGLLFAFVEGESKSLQQVSAVLLEPISAEPFRLRAEYDFEHHYEQSIADLDQAIQLDPSDDVAFWIRAQKLDASGQTTDAMASIEKAVELKPTSPRYRLTRADLYAKTDRLQEGISEIKSLLRELDMEDEVMAESHNLLGDLMTIGPKADHQVAMKNHLKAIDFASKCVDDKRFSVRRSAKETLVRAHASVARDIALGNFQRQAEVVPKWLMRANDLVEEFISDDRGDELLRLEVFRDALSSYLVLETGNFEVAVAVEEAVNTGRDYISRSKSEYYKTEVQRILSETLLHAAKMERTRGKYDSAIRFADTAIALLDSSPANWESSAHDDYLKAQLSFVIGSVYAIRDNDHQEAVKWYTKSQKLFDNSSFTTALYSDRIHGEMYVSMGLSFWEAGDQDDAIELTHQGALLMKKAVESGSMKLEAMTVPYSNLAAMHKKNGDARRSQEYVSLVAKVEDLLKAQK